MSEVRNSPPVLSYRARRNRSMRPSALLATLLHLPATGCWTIFIVAAFDSDLIHRMEAHEQFSAGLFAMALITAMVSLVLYAGASVPKSGYVVLNLAINICGLVFTVAAIPFAVLFLIFYSALH